MIRPGVGPTLLLSRSAVSDSVRPRRRQPTRLPRPWDSPGKNTGGGCQFLLQCMKVKSASEVARSCPTLHDPMDCSPPGSSVHGIFQARALEWAAIAFSGWSHIPVIKSSSWKNSLAGLSAKQSHSDLDNDTYIGYHELIFSTLIKPSHSVLSED